MDLKELNKFKKKQLIKMIQESKEYSKELEEVNIDLFNKIKKNDDYKKKFIELQNENISLVIQMNKIKDTMNSKIEEMINKEENDTIDYLKKRIKQTQNEKQENYINYLKNYMN